MCSPGGAVLRVPVQFSVFRRPARCHTLKATRLEARMAPAHDARAAPALLRKPELLVPARMGPVLKSLAHLRRSLKLAQIRSASQTDRPGRGPHGDGAGRASAVFRPRLVPEASQFVPEQPVRPEPTRRQTPA